MAGGEGGRGEEKGGGGEGHVGRRGRRASDQSDEEGEEEKGEENSPAHRRASARRRVAFFALVRRKVAAGAAQWVARRSRARAGRVARAAPPQWRREARG